MKRTKKPNVRKMPKGDSAPQQRVVPFDLNLIQDLINYLEKQPFREVAYMHTRMTNLVAIAGYGANQAPAPPPATPDAKDGG